MPEICRFLGLIVTIHVETGVRHHLPHFHARYGEYKAVYGIEPVVQLGGALPLPQQRMIEAWAEIYKADIRLAWDAVQQGRKAQRIRGLV